MEYIGAAITIASRFVNYPTNATSSSSVSATVPVSNHQTTNNISLNFNGPVDIKVSNAQTNVHGSNNKVKQGNKQEGSSNKAEITPKKSSGTPKIQNSTNKALPSPSRQGQIERQEGELMVLDPRLLDMTKVNDLTKYTRSIRKHEYKSIPFEIPLGCKIIPLRTMPHGFVDKNFIAYAGLAPEKTVESLKHGFSQLTKEGVVITLDPLYALSMVEGCILFQGKKFKIIIQVYADPSILKTDDTWSESFYKLVGWKDSRQMHVINISSLVPYAVCVFPEL